MRLAIVITMRITIDVDSVELLNGMEIMPGQGVGLVMLGRMGDVEMLTVKARGHLTVMMARI